MQAEILMTQKCLLHDKFHEAMRKVSHMPTSRTVREICRAVGTLREMAFGSAWFRENWCNSCLNEQVTH